MSDRPKRFRIGDVVIVTSGHISDFHNKIGIVEDTYDHVSNYDYCVRFADGDWYPLKDHEVGLAEASNEGD